MSDLKNIISEKRPNISKTSINTYNSILTSLYKKVFGPGEIDIKKFDETNKILDHLKTLEAPKRKTILSALVVITDSKEYREQMLDDIKEYNKEMAKQEKNKTQEENWVNNDDLNTIYNELLKTANILYKKPKLTNADYQEIQNYIIMSLLGGFYIPPRRSKDYVNFKIKNIDKKEDNYMDKNKLIFNSYKTAKTYGQQNLDIPKALKSILVKWIKVNPTEYLLFDISLKPLSNVKLNQRLNKLFGKKVSVNQLRHTYLTEKYGDMIDIKNQLNKDMSDMGSSLIQEQIYIKK